MRTISQVAELTGISTRTLQYYDEIGLLKPSEVTPAGYRLYDEEALEKLQQILFFKELDFKLKEIREILQNSEFDKIEAYKKQKKLLCLKRDRLNNLISLLGKLEKGEQCMNFKEFDLSEYIEALEQFKTEKSDEVIKYWGSMENFEAFISKARTDESRIAQLAIKQYGSVEKYTNAMKENLAHIPELMEKANKLKENIDETAKKSEDQLRRLTADLTRPVSSPEIQAIVREVVGLSAETSLGIDMGEGFWDLAIESYSHELVKSTTDGKYGEGASDYIARALRYYFHQQ